MKKTLTAVLAILLALLIPAGALASEGDVTIYHVRTEDGVGFYSVENVMLVGDKVYYVIGQDMCVYDIATQETTTYDAMNLFSLDGLDIAQAAEDGEENVYQSLNCVVFFEYGGELYALTALNTSYAERDGSSVDGGYIFKVALSGDSVKLEKSDFPKLDWTNMVETYDQYSYSRYPQMFLCDGGTLYLLVSDDSGNNMLEAFDLATGSCSERYIQNLYGMAAAGDGRLLVELYDWNKPEEASFAFYDYASDSFEDKGVVPVESYNPPTNIVYRSETDTVYYVSVGELWAAQGFDFENAVSVNAVPVNGGRNGSGVMTEDGFLLLSDWETIVLRNTDASKKSEVTLRINDFSYSTPVETAYYEYTNQHGDVSVVINRDGNQSDILQAMMNRSGAVDIYCLPFDSSVCNALFERGYMAELDGSEKLTGAMEGVYSSIRDAVTKNGSLYAIPISLNGYRVGYNPEALEKLGLTTDDLPKTWDEFFDFLDNLPALLENNTEVRAFESYYDQSGLRYQLFFQIFNDYQNYINAGKADYSFNTPIMQGLIDRLENVDWDALDVVERSYDEETDTWYDNYDGRPAVIQTSVCSTIASYREGNPLPLGFNEGDEPALPVNMTVMFVNPFSEHADQAIAYLETVMDCLDTVTYYNFYADRNEPIRYPDYEEYKANLQQWYEDAKKALETCEEDEKEIYEEQISYYEESLAEIDDTYWMISAEAIAEYRKHADNLQPVVYNCLSYSNDDDTSSELWEIMNQYYDGLIDSRALLVEIDKKVQMMRLEGN